MHTFLFVCFGVGVGFILLSFIFGELLGLADFDFGDNFSFEAGISPLKPQIISIFMTVFGGVGLLLEKQYISIWVVVPTALLAALAIAFLIFKFIYVPLHKMQKVVIEKQSLIGYGANVTEPIPQGGYGKITYIADGNTYSSPAKSEDGNEIARNIQVVITHIDKNTYYVRKA